MEDIKPSIVRFQLLLCHFMLDLEYNCYCHCFETSFFYIFPRRLLPLPSILPTVLPCPFVYLHYSNSKLVILIAAKFYSTQFFEE